MIYRGIVEQVIDRYTAKVRLPIIHRSKHSPQSTLDSDLPTATLCTIPNSHIALTAGDIVIVGFENNDIGRPIILGFLYKEATANSALSTIFSSIDVSGSARLPQDTTIGDIKSSDLNNLRGLSSNIQGQLNLLSDYISDIYAYLPTAIDTDRIYTWGDFQFKNKSNEDPEFICVGFSSSSNSILNLSIPSVLFRYKVTEIDGIEDRGAFSNTNIKTLITSPNLTTIGNYSFNNCVYLQSVDIPQVIHIKEGAFSNCTSLSNVKFSSSLKEISISAFGGCGSLKKLDLRGINTLESIGEWSFKASGLQEVYLPSYDIGLSYGTFEDCKSLDKAELGGLTTIPERCFSGCSNLKNITLPDSLTTIDWSSFAGSGLKSIDIPNTVTSIGQEAFNGCTQLTEITLGLGVSILPIAVFANCTSLKSVNIPEKVTSIKADVFSDCSALREISLPSSLTSIGNDVFKGCISTESEDKLVITYAGSENQWKDLIKETNLGIEDDKYTVICKGTQT